MSSTSPRHSRLTYVAKSLIPSRAANSVQVVQMVCALSRLFPQIELVVPFKLSRYLSLRFGRGFRLYGQQRPPNLLMRFAGTTDSARFIAKVKEHAESIAEGLLYTRNIEVAHRFAASEASVIYESHDSGRDAAYVGCSEFVAAVNQNRRARIVCISSFLEAFYRMQGLREDRAGVFPDGVDESFFAARPGGRLRSLFGPAVEESRKIVYTGSLGPEKGAHFLVEAARRMPGHNFVVIGGNERESRALSEEAKGLGNVFIRSHLAHVEVPVVLSEADYLVMPYLSEGKWTECMSPLKMFEYLAAGRIVVASDLQVLGDVLEDGVNCVTHRPGDIDAFCRAIRRIDAMTDGEKDEIRRRGSAQAKSLTWTNRARNIIDWYYEDS